jgi:hypothetical protein
MRGTTLEISDEAACISPHSSSYPALSAPGLELPAWYQMGQFKITVRASSEHKRSVGCMSWRAEYKCGGNWIEGSIQHTASELERRLRSTSLALPLPNMAWHVDTRSTTQSISPQEPPLTLPRSKPLLSIYRYKLRILKGNSSLEGNDQRLLGSVRRSYVSSLGAGSRTIRLWFLKERCANRSSMAVLPDRPFSLMDS